LIPLSEREVALQLTVSISEGSEAFHHILEGRILIPIKKPPVAH
jgi:hypothetical protein